MSRTCEARAYALKIEDRFQKHVAFVRGDAVDPNKAVPSSMRSVVGRIPIISRILDRSEPTFIRVPRKIRNNSLHQNGEVKRDNGASEDHHYTLTFNEDGVLVREFGPGRDAEPAVATTNPKGELIIR